MNSMRALAASPRQMATIWRCATGSAADAAHRAAAVHRAGRAPPSRLRASRGAAAARNGDAELAVDRDVLQHRQVGKQRQVLEDDLNAERLGLVGRQARVTRRRRS